MGEAATKPVEHGGSLEKARALFPNAPLPLVDLSTGINPHSYPLLDLPATALTRLPEPARIDALCKVAARAYGAPSSAHVAAAPGTQLLLPMIAGMVAPGRARILGPTYEEHPRAAALAGHQVEIIRDIAALADADLAVVVNPNNPDGRLLDRPRLCDLAKELSQRGGLLVVDEAFMDCSPAGESMTAMVDSLPIVVLRSFGKFYGLAGVRLGFAIASKAIAARLHGLLGPWAISGPALGYGLQALADTDWRDATRKILTVEIERLKAVFGSYGLTLEGEANLFQIVRSGAAPDIYRALGRNGVIVRAFADRPEELRCGLPCTQEAWDRLERALGAWCEAKEPKGKRRR